MNDIPKHITSENLVYKMSRFSFRMATSSIEDEIHKIMKRK
jgi:hypothetical protein